MKVVETIAITLATALGAGFSPIGPGTCGTLVAVPLFWLLCSLPLWLYLVTVAGITAIGTWAGDITGKKYGEVDCQRIVIDEVAGYLVTMALSKPTWVSMLAGFVLFRLFDILKPFPVSWADQKVKNAFGVMLDDLLAGGYALLVMLLLKALFPAWF